MHIFKYAKRVEVDNNYSMQVASILREPLPERVSFAGTNKDGKWYEVRLPASTWALAVRSSTTTTVGIYHSPALLKQELKEANVAEPISEPKA